MADQTPAGEREGSPGAREDFRRRIEGGPDAGGSERDFGAPVESEVPLKNHNVKRIRANNMQVGVPVHAVDHNKARHEEGHEPRFRFPTPVGWGHGVYNDTGTNKFPPNYHGKANNIDASGGIFTEQDEDDGDQHPMESLHRSNVGVWNRAAAVKKDKNWQPIASHPLNNTGGSPLRNSTSLYQSRAITNSELMDGGLDGVSPRTVQGYGKPQYTSRNITSELETPYARSLQLAPDGASTPRTTARAEHEMQPRGGQRLYAKGTHPFINSPNPLLNRVGPPPPQRPMPGDAETPRGLTTHGTPSQGTAGQGTPRMAGTLEDNPLQRRKNKTWANKVGASAHLRSKGMMVGKDVDSDSGDEEHVTMKSYTKRRGYNPHTTKMTTIDNMGREVQYPNNSRYSAAAGGMSAISRDPNYTAAGAAGGFVPEYLKPDEEPRPTMTIHEQLYAGLENPQEHSGDLAGMGNNRGLPPSSTSRSLNVGGAGFGSRGGTNSKVMSTFSNRNYVEITTGVPKFTMTHPPPHPDEEAEYRLQRDQAKWHWKYEPGYEVPLQLLLTRGLRPRYHMSSIDHHMVKELIQDCRRLMGGDYLVRYSRKGGLPHERFVALVMHPPRQGDEPVPMLLWRQHQNSNNILERSVLANLVGVSFDSHSKVFKPFKVYPEGVAPVNETEEEEPTMNLDEESVGTLDSLSGGPQALFIEGPTMGGSKRPRLSCDNAFTLWFLDPHAMDPKSVDVVTRTRSQAVLWVKVMRGLLAINNVSLGEYQAENQQRIVEWVRDELETTKEEGMFEATDVNDYLQ